MATKLQTEGKAFPVTVTKVTECAHGESYCVMLQSKGLTVKIGDTTVESPGVKYKIFLKNPPTIGSKSNLNLAHFDVIETEETFTNDEGDEIPYTERVLKVKKSVAPNG